MTTPSVLMLCNRPLLPRDHPAAESEHSVLAIADSLMKLLAEEYDVSQLLLGPDPTVLWQELSRRPPDVVFNLYEGEVDRPETESYVAGLLEWAGVPFTGSPFRTLTLARAKHLTKYLLQNAGLPTADFTVVDRLPAPPWQSAFPVIVKPAQLDASLGVDQESVCENETQLASRIQHVLANYGPPVLVEEFVEGREFNMALVELPELRAMPPYEIVFPENCDRWSVMTYAGKWRPGTAEYEETPQRRPVELPYATTHGLGELAQKAYRLLGCRDYARVDFRMNEVGKPFILEINPNPELNDEAGFASAFGTHREFIVRLVQRALARKKV